MSTPDLFGEPGVSLAAQIREVERELALREKVYPRRIAAAQMTKATAERQVAAMRAVLDTLRSLAR